MKRLVLVYSILLVILAGACTPESKLAKEFRANPPEFYFHLDPPAYLYKYNHKGEMIENLDQMSPAQQDSALFASSTFIQYISDSTFLVNYVNAFLSELRNLGFPVYIGSEADSFLMAQPQSYEINIAQIQLDEYFYPYEDEEYFYDTLFYKRFDLDALDFSVWVELTRFNHPGNIKTVLYSSHMASDNLEGDFVLDPFRQQVKYSYTIDSLNVSDVNDIAKLLGKVHASYLYDFFLNQYIAFHIPKGFQPQVYYHYNRFRNTFVPVDEDRFELLNNQ